MSNAQAVGILSRCTFPGTYNACRSRADTNVQRCSKPRASPRAQFSETILDEDNTIRGSRGVSLPVRSIEFCQLLLRFHGAVRHQVRIDAGELYDLEIADLAKQMLLPQPSLSLSEALKLNDITDD
ncbi:hypothetical protein LTR82_018361, partial [Friedmanniomyces endolithicus]